MTGSIVNRLEKIEQALSIDEKPLRIRLFLSYIEDEPIIESLKPDNSAGFFSQL